MTTRERTKAAIVIPIEEEDGYAAYIRDSRRYPLLSPAEEIELAQRIEQGDLQAKQRFIEGNLQLVVSIAWKYRHSRLPLLDRIQAGNMGLIRAIEKFDWRTGNKFSTYATAWIHQAIMRAVHEEKTAYHIPEHVFGKILAVKRAVTVLRDELQREPTHAEIAERTGMTVERVRDLLITDMAPCSLDAPLDKYEATATDMEMTLKDVLVFETDLVDSSERSALKDAVQAALQSLTERERTIITLRYGIGMERSKSLEEVGKELGVTRERIRQIEAKVIKEKLYRPMQRAMRQWNEVAV